MSHDGLTLTVELLTDGGTIVKVTQGEQHRGVFLVRPDAEVSFTGGPAAVLPHPLGDRDGELIDALLLAAVRRTGNATEPSPRRPRRDDSPQQRSAHLRGLATGLALGIAAGGGS